MTKLKKQIVTKLENSNCDRTKKKTQIVTKLKKSNCDKTHKLKFFIVVIMTVATEVVKVK